jgi:4-amino-4-deoxy-L-arabinose transferase-like glycosyltransferase
VEVLRKIPRLAWLVAPLVYFLYFFRLGGAGLVGPDEPRYAWIGRAMAQTGDWVTPRLWGEPWFEKPALIYWMTGAAFRLGLGPDLAPRLPVALASVAFLAFYWWILRREFTCRAASMATAILGTSVAWLGFSQAGAPDLPLTASFSAAMLLALPWVAKRDGRYLPAASALLGVAVLAKGLVPLALAAPLALRVGWARDLLRPRVLLPFLAVAAPWYVLCYAQNGWAFVDEFILKHHFGRFASGALQHVQPWWFYLARFPLLLLPWMPLLALAALGGGWRDPRRRFLAVWVVFGLLLFSASANKLPGYVLPLLPGVAALAALALEQAKDARVWLASCAALLVVFPIAGPVLPAAAANEWTAAPRIAFHWSWLLPAIPIAAVLALEARGRRIAAVLTIAVAVAVGLSYLKVRSEGEMGRIASARALAAEVRRHPGQVCAGALKRDWEYGLHYYLGAVLPPCEANPKAFQVLQIPGKPPAVVPKDPAAGTPAPPQSVDPR